MEATSRKPRPSERDSESNSYQHYEHYYHILPLPQSKCMECYSNYGEYIIPNIIKPSILLQKKQPGFTATDQVLKADGVQTTDLCENIN